MINVEYIKEFLRSFLKITSKAALYGPAHPSTRSALASFGEGLAKLLDAEGELSVSSIDAKIIVNKTVIEEKGPLFEVFEKLGLYSISFIPGVSEGELEELVAAFASGDQGAAIFKSGSSRIRVNGVHYVRSGAKAEMEDGRLTAADIDGLGFEQLIKKVVERAVKKDDDRKKVFEAVMRGFASEVETKVKEATVVLEKEIEDLAGQKEAADKLIGSAVLSTITVDDAGNVVMLDEDAEKIVSARLREKAGRPVWEGLGEGQMVTVSVRGGDAYTVGSVVMKGEDATRRTIRASNAVIRNVEGRMVGLFSMLSDVTKYRELDRMKRDFVAGVTHELRTPLVATKQALANILAFSNSLDADMKKMVEIAMRNTDRLCRLVNDILDFSKHEAGRLKLNQEIVEPGPLLRDVAASLKPLADSKGVALDLDLRGALPRVLADRERVTQVLINLVGNAVKFTAGGGRVTLYSPGVQIDGQDGFLEVAVRDTGCGIETRDLVRIFDKFVQVGAQGSSINGTGLGLAISKAIVELHGGVISVQSRPGAGSVFTFTVPVLPEDALLWRRAAKKTAG